MTRHVVACHEEASIDEAVSLMARERVRRLMVVNGGRELASVISLPDLARLEDSGMDLSAAALRVIFDADGNGEDPRARRPGRRPRSRAAGRDFARVCSEASY